VDKAVKAIDRVNTLRRRLQESCGSGRHASTAASLIVKARNQVLAAKARLAILQKGAEPRSGVKR
jgi:hypothetical protein